MKYLFISAHMDDCELACGGTMVSLIERGHTVNVITLSCIYEEKNLSIEWVKSMDKLGVDHYSKMNFKTRYFNTQHDEILQYLFKVEKYDFIFAPSSADAHMDHSTVGRICERVFKNENLITYQHIWNSRETKSNLFVELEKHHIQKKIEALACYKSQAHKSYMNPEYIWANAINNGVQCGVKYAESYNVFNIII